MKVMMVNGSPHPQGNTAMALQEMQKVFAENGVEVEMVHVGNKAIRGCIGCRACAQKGKCVFDDIVNETAPLFAECDGLVVGSPVYYASANATLVAYLTRLFFSTGFDKTMKVGASVVVARRQPLMNSISSSPSRVCPLLPVNTGTVFMAGHREKRRRILRACRLCGHWRVI